MYSTNLASRPLSYIVDTAPPSVPPQLCPLYEALLLIRAVGAHRPHLQVVGATMGAVAPASGDPHSALTYAAAVVALRFAVTGGFGINARRLAAATAPLVADSTPASAAAQPARRGAGRPPSAARGGAPVPRTTGAHVKCLSLLEALDRGPPTVTDLAIFVSAAAGVATGALRTSAHAGFGDLLAAAARPARPTAAQGSSVVAHVGPLHLAAWAAGVDAPPLRTIQGDAHLADAQPASTMAASGACSAIASDSATTTVLRLGVLDGAVRGAGSGDQGRRLRVSVGGAWDVTRWDLPRGGAVNASGSTMSVGVVAAPCNGPEHGAAGGMYGEDGASGVDGDSRDDELFGGEGSATGTDCGGVGRMRVGDGCGVDVGDVNILTIDDCDTFALAAATHVLSTAVAALAGAPAAVYEATLSLSSLPQRSAAATAAATAPAAAAPGPRSRTATVIKAPTGDAPSPAYDVGSPSPSAAPDPLHITGPPTLAGAVPTATAMVARWVSAAIAGTAPKDPMVDPLARGAEVETFDRALQALEALSVTSPAALPALAPPTATGAASDCAGSHSDRSTRHARGGVATTTEAATQVHTPPNLTPTPTRSPLPMVVATGPFLNGSVAHSTVAVVVLPDAYMRGAACGPNVPWAILDVDNPVVFGGGGVAACDDNVAGAASLAAALRANADAAARGADVALPAVVVGVRQSFLLDPCTTFSHALEDEVEATPLRNHGHVSDEEHPPPLRKSLRAASHAHGMSAPLVVGETRNGRFAEVALSSAVAGATAVMRGVFDHVGRAVWGAAPVGAAAMEEAKVHASGAAATSSGRGRGLAALGDRGGGDAGTCGSHDDDGHAACRGLQSSAVARTDGSPATDASVGPDAVEAERDRLEPPGTRAAASAVATRRVLWAAASVRMRRALVAATEAPVGQHVAVLLDTLDAISSACAAELAAAPERAMAAASSAVAAGTATTVSPPAAGMPLPWRCDVAAEAALVAAADAGLSPTCAALVFEAAHAAAVPMTDRRMAAHRTVLSAAARVLRAALAASTAAAIADSAASYSRAAQYDGRLHHHHTTTPALLRGTHQPSPSDGGHSARSTALTPALAEWLTRSPLATTATAHRILSQLAVVRAPSPALVSATAAAVAVHLAHSWARPSDFTEAFSTAAALTGAQPAQPCAPLSPPLQGTGLLLCVTTARLLHAAVNAGAVAASALGLTFASCEAIMATCRRYIEADASGGTGCGSGGRASPPSPSSVAYDVTPDDLIDAFTRPALDGTCAVTPHRRSCAPASGAATPLEGEHGSAADAAVPPNRADRTAIIDHVRCLFFLTAHVYVSRPLSPQAAAALLSLIPRADAADASPAAVAAVWRWSVHCGGLAHVGQQALAATHSAHTLGYGDPTMGGGLPVASRLPPALQPVAWQTADLHTAMIMALGTVPVADAGKRALLDVAVAADVPGHIVAALQRIPSLADADIASSGATAAHRRRGAAAATMHPAPAGIRKGELCEDGFPTATPPAVGLVALAAAPSTNVRDVYVRAGRAVARAKQAPDVTSSQDAGLSGSDDSKSQRSRQSGATKHGHAAAPARAAGGVRTRAYPGMPSVSVDPTPPSAPPVEPAGDASAAAYSARAETIRRLVAAGRGRWSKLDALTALGSVGGEEAAAREALESSAPSSPGALFVSFGDFGMGDDAV